MTLSNFDRYQRIAWAYDLLDLPFEYGRYRKIRPQIFSGLSGRILDAGVGTGRNFPFYPPGSERANVGFAFDALLDVAVCAAGDSAFGCRQMIGNVWEWTASDFVPFPGFAADPYEDYSRPWFHTRKVLRGGSFATSARLARPLYRNFFTPERNDVIAGFRTCAR